MSNFSHNQESDVAVKEKEVFKEPSKYNVIAHNNDLTSYEEVMIILSQSFEMSNKEALAIASKIDVEGKGICGTYSKEIADMKLILIDMIKKQLIQMIPVRAREISILKFTVEKA